MGRVRNPSHLEERMEGLGNYLLMAFECSSIKILLIFVFPSSLLIIGLFLQGEGRNMSLINCGAIGL